MGEATLDRAIALSKENAGGNSCREGFAKLLEELKINTDWENVKEPSVIPPTDD
jgi:hypothetical protein